MDLANSSLDCLAGRSEINSCFIYFHFFCHIFFSFSGECLFALLFSNGDDAGLVLFPKTLGRFEL